MTTKTTGNKETSGVFASDTELQSKKIWDLPTRIFHWALVLTITTGWYLGQFRDFSTVELHIYFGYSTGALLVFRLLWGFVGPAPVRFSNVIPDRTSVLKYMATAARRKPSGVAGHNPIGGLSVAALLIIIATQVLTGLFAEDDSLYASGPLSKYATEKWVLIANDIHYKSSRILLILVGLHVAAIIFYQIWKRENLVLPMITGWKWVRVRKD